MFETASYGAGFTSNVRMNSDSNSLQIGAGQDLKFFHNGSNSFITNDTGGLYIRSDVLGLEDQTNGHSYLGAQRDGAVTIRYDNSVKFETASYGFKSQGTGEVDIVLGSTNAGGAFLVLDGDSNGDASGSDYASIGHDTAGNLSISARNPASNAEIQFRVQGGHRISIDSSGNFVPALNNNYDLGTSSLRWRNLYTTDLQLSNEGKTNDVDGTWGDYTIQEGESDLFLINNRSGKKYKFNLTEVS